MFSLTCLLTKNNSFNYCYAFILSDRFFKFQFLKLSFFGFYVLFSLYNLNYLQGDSSSEDKYGGQEESEEDSEVHEDDDDDCDDEEEEEYEEDDDVRDVDCDDDEDDEDDRDDHLGYDDYDSGVNTDMSLVTVPPRSPSPSPHAPLRRTASTKIIHLINLLQQEASKYDLVLTCLLLLFKFLNKTNH